MDKFVTQHLYVQHFLYKFYTNVISVCLPGYTVFALLFCHKGWEEPTKRWLTLKRDCWLEDCRREQFINTGRGALHGSVLINSPVGGNDTELNHSEATSHARSHVLELVVERLAEQ